MFPQAIQNRTKPSTQEMMVLLKTSNFVMSQVRKVTKINAHNPQIAPLIGVDGKTKPITLNPSTQQYLSNSSLRTNSDIFIHIAEATTAKINCFVSLFIYLSISFPSYRRRGGGIDSHGANISDKTDKTLGPVLGSNIPSLTFYFHSHSLRSH